MPQLNTDNEFKRKKRRVINVSAPLWTVTFSDLTTLLLTFFIILLTTAKIDGHELKIILSNFPGLDKLLTGSTFVDGPFTSQSVLLESSISNVVDTALNEAKEDLIGFFQEFEQNIVLLKSDERGLSISFATDYFFERYSSKIDLLNYGDVLRKVAQVLTNFAQKGGYFRVEGHADETNFPIGLKFSDAWELSSARAISFIQLLEKYLVPIENAHISGYGNTKPLIDQETESIFNRRVDLILLNEGNL